MGAAVYAAQHGKTAVGLDNHTSFLKAVRHGRLIATATPISRGKRVQLWEGVVKDDEGALVATGRVRLMAIEDGRSMGGEPIGVVPKSQG